MDRCTNLGADQSSPLSSVMSRALSAAKLSTASRGRNTRLRTYLTPRNLRKALACAFTANKQPINAQ